MNSLNLLVLGSILLVSQQSPALAGTSEKEVQAFTLIKLKSDKGDAQAQYDTAIASLT